MTAGGLWSFRQQRRPQVVRYGSNSRWARALNKYRLLAGESGGQICQAVYDIVTNGGKSSRGVIWGLEAAPKWENKDLAVDVLPRWM